MQSFIRASAVVIGLAIAVVPAVSRAERIEERIAACSKERDDARRLACYDNVVSGVETPSGGSRAPSPGAQSTLPRAARGSNEDEFGVEGSELAKQRRAREAKSPDAPNIRSLSAVVTDVASEARGILVITLDNDQVWRQKTPESYFAIKVGDRVTINAGVLGSYRMVNGRRSTQVTRVK